MFLAIPWKNPLLPTPKKKNFKRLRVFRSLGYKSVQQKYPKQENQLWS